MSNHPIVPCLWFDDQAEQAASFYTTTFSNGRILARSHYPEGAANPGGKPPGSVLTVELELAGQRFTALNGGPQFAINPSISFFAWVDTPAEADRLFAALEPGGKVLMPLASYPWSPRYAWVQDRFGVSWQVIAGQRAPAGAGITPCLMFGGPQQDQAEAALQLYTRVFPGSEVESVARYEPGEGPAGKVKHGRVRLRGQTLIAMDSGVSQPFGFNEAVSLQILCADQAEVDHYWAALCEGGTPGPCGWLKDRFGLSWQVVPSAIVEWLTSQDVAARDRAFAAVMQMSKIDIAAVRAAMGGT